MKNTKKGFTLVELLVVIAIVAILATVAIIGYTSFLKKADLSNDQSAIAQMNTALQASAIPNGFENPSDAIDALYNLGWNFGKMQPYSNNFKYAYNYTENKMYLIDDKGDVVYPEAADKAKLWGFYYDSVGSMIDGITNYIAMKNITNIVNFQQSFATGTYNIDLNGYYVDLKGDTTVYNVTVSNGAYISGELTRSESAIKYEVLEVSDVQSNQPYENIVLTGFNGSETTGKDLPTGVSFKDCVIYDSSFMISGDATFTNCTFVGGVNNATIYVENTSSDAVINIINCTFENSVLRPINVASPSQVNIVDCVFNGTSTVDKHIIQIADVNAKVNINGCTFNALGTAPGIIRFNDGLNGKYAGLENNVTWTNNTISSDIPVDKYVDMDGIGSAEAKALDEAVTNKMK